MAVGTGVFRFLELPAPVQTFKTASTPAFSNRIFAPTFSQLCRSIRAESLQYELKYRPVEISLHSPANVDLAEKWALEPASHASEYRTYVFTGGIMAADNDFYEITVTRLKEAPFFSVTGKAVGGSLKAEQGASDIKWKVSDQLLMAHGRNGTLTPQGLYNLINMVFSASRELPKQIGSETQDYLRASMIKWV